MISDYRYNDTVRISCLFLGRDISQRCLQELPFVLLFVVQKNATESAVIRVNNRNMRIKCVQMGAYAYFGTRFSTRICGKSVHAFCGCIGCLSLTCTIVSWTPGLTQISCKGVDAEAWWTFRSLLLIILQCQQGQEPKKQQKFYQIVDKSLCWLHHSDIIPCKI